MTKSDIRELCAPARGGATAIAVSESMQRFSESLARLSRVPRANVIILGERGSGRHHAVRLLHEATFPEGQLICVDATTPTSALVQMRNRTWPAAGTTIYFHELSELSREGQEAVKSLWAQLQDTAEPIRLVASRSSPSGRASQNAEQLPGLAYCFPSELSIPALRDRRAGIPALLELASNRAAAIHGLDARFFEQPEIDRLTNADWPGNVQELFAFVERACLLSTGDALLVHESPATASLPPAFVLPPEGVVLSQVEHDLTVQALTRSAGNQTQAARLLGLTRDQLRYRMKKMDLLRQEPAPVANSVLAGTEPVLPPPGPVRQSA